MVDDTTELVPADFGNYIGYASYLCDIAKKTATGGQQKAWENRFLAGCLYFAAPRLPPLANHADTPKLSTSSRTTLRRWAKIASLVNSIVAGLLEFWGDRAYWVYEAVVGELGAYANLWRLSETRNGNRRYPQHVDQARSETGCV